MSKNSAKSIRLKDYVERLMHKFSLMMYLTLTSNRIHPTAASLKLRRPGFFAPQFLISSKIRSRNNEFISRLSSSQACTRFLAAEDRIANLSGVARLLPVLTEFVC